jgi:hypothetical protein
MYYVDGYASGVTMEGIRPEGLSGRRRYHQALAEIKERSYRYGHVSLVDGGDIWVKADNWDNAIHKMTYKGQVTYIRGRTGGIFEILNHYGVAPPDVKVDLMHKEWISPLGISKTGTLGLTDRKVKYWNDVGKINYATKGVCHQSAVKSISQSLGRSFLPSQVLPRGFDTSISTALWGTGDLRGGPLNLYLNYLNSK